jgi:predicted acetyltransferase
MVVQREIRPVTADEVEDFFVAENAAFGQVPEPEQLALYRSLFELDRSVAVLEAGQFVGTAGAYSFDLTVPGAATVPACGVSWVGVLPTHRRRGILSAMMGHQLADVARRGEPLALLTASEGSIYRRFGYGVASEVAAVEVDKHRAGFRSPPSVGGRVRLVRGEEGAKLVPPLYDAFRRRRTGALTRNDRYWEIWFQDPERWRGGASARFVAVHESDDGVADGFASYRFKEDWDDHANRSQVRVQGVYATDEEVEAALWRFLFDIDLAVTVKSHARPLDDPIPWRLTDHRGWRVTAVGDWLWACLVDVAAALSARSYGTGGSVVVEVADGFRPEAGGRFRLDGGPDGAECARTDAEPDLAIGTADLAAAYLGGARLGTLHRAGLVEERTAGAVAVADAMFATDRLPFCDTGF